MRGKANYSVNFGFPLLADQTDAHKAGSTDPIKNSLVDANGSHKLWDLIVRQSCHCFARAFGFLPIEHRHHN